ncbi:MAG: GreA/GreB family elongation factor, partial [Chlamydiia bacterium]|nr:GreA/GreB family elongation factor [Chlamydiia bacterium]
LEEEAKSDPVKVIHLMLKDLGPKTAQDIKDELCEWVIPEEEWTKWWQTARSKLKKDTMMEVPSSLKDPFVLRSAAISHEERFHKELLKSVKPDEIILATYNFVRDFPGMLTREGVRSSIIEKLSSLLNSPNLTKAEELQVYLFMDNFLDARPEGKNLKEALPSPEEVDEILREIPILAFKKRLLTAIRSLREDWVEIFLEMLLKVDQNPLREYIYGELSGPETITQLEHKLEEMLAHPKEYPDTFVWYFQKIMSDKDALFSDKDGQCEFFEALFILMHQIEGDPSHRELVKKMYNHLTHKRYQIVRAVLEGSTIDFAKEFLLLVTKCQTLTSHDLKIMRSLAEVAHPSLSEDKGEEPEEDLVIWSTDKGYNKLRERIQQIGTVEIVENAREIEDARALGDLRENSEYKFAQEKRARLQGELKLLSDQLNRARIITEQDVALDAVSVGTVVELINSQGGKVTYTILGPWDANPDENILSFQSKMAQAMIGYKVGEKFSFRHDTYTVSDIRSYL